MLGSAWCVRGLNSSAIAVLPRALWWHTIVAQCSAVFGHRITRHEREREEAATTTERCAFSGYLLHVGQSISTGYQSMCAVDVLCISLLRCDASGIKHIFVALDK